MIKTGLKHMRACLPEEGCGLILKSGRFIPSENFAGRHPSVQGMPSPENTFLLDHRLYIRHSRELSAVVHSHVTDGEDAPPSPGDYLCQRALGVPLYTHVLTREGRHVATHKI